MCTLLMAIEQHAEYPWVIAANRDEYRDRPTAPMDWWPEHPNLLAGRDLRAGGTWMGMTRSGRFAAVTNFREPRCVYPRGPSRGALVHDFLTGTASPRAYGLTLAREGRRYDGFNLVMGDTRSGLYYCGNRGANRDDRNRHGRHPVDVAPLPPGIYGLSNHCLDTPWPKVTRGKALLAESLSAADDCLETRLLETLADTAQPADADLPDTGVGLEWERMLAPLFINTPHYGTRSCSVVRLDRNGHLTVVERTIPHPGETDHRQVDRRFRFRIGV